MRMAPPTTEPTAMTERRMADKNGGVETANAEVSESDPCMDYKRPERRDGVVRNVEGYLMRKSGLDRRNVRYAVGLLFLLAVLFVTVVVLSATWPRTPHHYQFPVCQEAACLRAAAQIREGLNTSSSPCDDVWQWACGGWLSENKLPEGKSNWNQKQQLLQLEAVRIRDLISTLPLPLHSTTVEWKLKHLYDACMDVDNVNADKARPLTSIIASELGGWYVLRNWNIEDFDARVTLRDIHVKYGVSPYFKISVEPNPQFPGHSSITISPSGLGLPHKSYYYAPENDRIQQAYKQLIHDVVISLSATRSEAETFGNNIFYYEKRIAEITPDPIDLQNPVKTYNLIKVSELKQTLPTLPLQDILMAMYPESNVTEETEVVLKSPEYLSDVSQIVASTDRATLNSYLIWTLVKQYLPYLSTEFVAASNSFEKELFGYEKPLKRWEKCVDLVKQFMSVGVDAMLQRRNPISNETYNIVEEMLETVRDVVDRKLERYRTHMPDLYRHLKSKVMSLRLQIGFPDLITDDNYLKFYYKKFLVMKANLFDTVRNGFLFLKKSEERRLIKQKPEDFLFIPHTFEQPRVEYFPSENKVVVPRVLLSQNFFESKFPRAIIYGRLGVEMAEAVTSAVLPYGSTWTSDLKLLSPFHVIVNESIMILDNLRRCLQQELPNEPLIAGYFTNRTTFSVAKHVIAVDVAYEALEATAKIHAHVHQPSLEMYEDSALYFVSYAQTKCSIATKEHELHDSIVNFRISQNSLLQLSVKQVPHFLQSFACAEGKTCDLL